MFLHVSNATKYCMFDVLLFFPTFHPLLFLFWLCLSASQFPWLNKELVWLASHFIIWGPGSCCGVGVCGYFLYNTNVRAECRPHLLFQRCQVYDWPPFFNKKYMNDPSFLDFCVKGLIFWHPGICICTYFSLRDFSRLLLFIGLKLSQCDIYKTEFFVLYL